ncbi:L-histidine N(alpha)-methyltransferase [Uliginosibacterium sp. sgz301328]|uniref:L-histidine N(alpha)-methyltransferase n=1 Tax=Uliginosibacterium sp. sgz301328 TaxID=3243764 RepID=UPI00359DD970
MTFAHPSLHHEPMPPFIGGTPVHLADTFAHDVLEGLSLPEKSIPPTWLYDATGCELFEAITDLPEYYPTRTEIGILRRCVGEIAEAVGPGAVVVEIGSGSSRKTPLLLHALESPQAYVPIDIADDSLVGAIPPLAARFPQIRFYPTVGDFRRPLVLPSALRDFSGRHLGFFPGSTIGNLRPHEAEECLANIRATLGRHALLVLGVDITRDPAVLLPAYDDAQGITAHFNLNLLARINRELDGNFDLHRFRHMVRYDHRRPRIEMHLVSTKDQHVRVLGQEFRFAEGETLHTENSYKYRLTELAPVARASGWMTENVWTDPDARFAVMLLSAMD